VAEKDFARSLEAGGVIRARKKPAKIASFGFDRCA
jgi:hypothetical protein